MRQWLSRGKNVMRRTGSGMDLEITEQTPDYIHVTLRQPIGPKDGPVLRRQLEVLSQHSARARDLILDLRPIGDSLNDEAVGTIISVFRDFQRRGRYLHVIGGEKTERIIRLSGAIIAVQETPAEARELIETRAVIIAMRNGDQGAHGGTHVPE